MLKFFDYFFYRAYFVYKKYQANGGWLWSASALVSFVQVCYAEGTTLLITSLCKIKTFDSLIYGEIFLILVYNFYRYSRVINIQDLILQFDNDQYEVRKRKGIFIWIVIIAGICLLFIGGGLTIILSH
jgi:hypothetical protein